jgi:hypothetical protein
MRFPSLSKSPIYHKDPFDRMLVCQAIVHGLTILTPDNLVDRPFPGCRLLYLRAFKPLEGGDKPRRYTKKQVKG